MSPIVGGYLGILVGVILVTAFHCWLAVRDRKAHEERVRQAWAREEERHDRFVDYMNETSGYSLDGGTGADR